MFFPKDCQFHEDLRAECQAVQRQEISEALARRVT